MTDDATQNMNNYRNIKKWTFNITFLFLKMEEKVKNKILENFQYGLLIYRCGKRKSDQIETVEFTCLRKKKRKPHKKSRRQKTPTCIRDWITCIILNIDLLLDCWSIPYYFHWYRWTRTYCLVWFLHQILKTEMIICLAVWNWV